MMIIKYYIPQFIRSQNEPVQYYKIPAEQNIILLEHCFCNNKILMNIIPSSNHNLNAYNLQEKITHKNNDFARRMFHDHKLMLERVKFLESENNRLSKQLKAALQRENTLKAEFDNYKKNEKIITDQIYQFLKKPTIYEKFPLCDQIDQIGQTLSEIPANYDVSLQLSDIQFCFKKNQTLLLQKQIQTDVCGLQSQKLRPYLDINGCNQEFVLQIESYEAFDNQLDVSDEVE